jgi:hypothetical protein
LKAGYPRHVPCFRKRYRLWKMSPIYHFRSPISGIRPPPVENVSDLPFPVSELRYSASAPSSDSPFPARYEQQVEQACKAATSRVPADTTCLLLYVPQVQSRSDSQHGTCSRYPATGFCCTCAAALIWSSFLATERRYLWNSSSLYNRRLALSVLGCKNGTFPRNLQDLTLRVYPRCVAARADSTCLPFSQLPKRPSGLLLWAWKPNKINIIILWIFRVDIINGISDKKSGTYLFFLIRINNRIFFK